jgi:hypothetical protein
MSRILRGAIAGAMATAPMTAVMVGAKQVGLMGGMPPEKITSSFLRRNGIRPSEGQQDAVATVLHAGFGTAAGAVFGVVAPKGLIARVPPGNGLWRRDLGRQLHGLGTRLRHHAGGRPGSSRSADGHARRPPGLRNCAGTHGRQSSRRIFDSARGCLLTLRVRRRSDPAASPEEHQLGDDRYCHECQADGEC